MGTDDNYNMDSNDVVEISNNGGMIITILIESCHNYNFMMNAYWKIPNNC